MAPSQPFTRTSRGLSDWSDFTRRLRNPDDIGIPTYLRMVDGDETVGAGIEFISLSVINYIGEYYHPRTKIQKFVREDILGMRSLLSVFVEEMLSGLWAGSATAELHLTEINGKVRTVDLPVLPPTTYDYTIESEGINTGCIAGVKQRQTKGEKFIAARSLIHWAHRGRFGNPYGNSRLKAAWKYWFPKDVLLACWGKTLEQYASPKPIARHPTPHVMIEVDGTTMRRGDYLLQQLSTLSESSQMVLDPEVILEFLEMKRSFGPDFEQWQAWSNQMILRACLIPSLLFTGGDGKGSYALAGKQTEVYNKGVYRIRDSICHALIHHWIAKMIFINYGEQSQGYGEFRGQSLEEEDLKMWSEIFYSMVQSNFIRAHVAEDFEFVRQKLGLPLNVAPPPEPAPEGGGSGGGKDGIPGEAPDGQDGNGPSQPRSTPKTPKKKQGRPNDE